MVKATQGYSKVLEYSTACYETICKAYTSHQSLFYCNILMILWYVAHHKYLANNGHKTYPICNLLKPVLHTWDTWSRSRANPKHTEAVLSVPKPLCHMSFGTMDPKQFRGRNPSLPWFMVKISVQMTKFVDLENLFTDRSHIRTANTWLTIHSVCLPKEQFHGISSDTIEWWYFSTKLDLVAAGLHVSISCCCSWKSWWLHHMIC